MSLPRDEREREREKIPPTNPPQIDRKQQLPQLPPHPPLDARLQHHNHPRHQRAALPLQRHRRRHHRPDLGQVERADLAHDVSKAHRHDGLHPGLRDHEHGRPPARRLHLRRRQLQRHEHHPRLGRHHVCADPREARRGAGHGQHEREYQPALVSCRWFPFFPFLSPPLLPPLPALGSAQQASKQSTFLAANTHLPTFPAQYLWPTDAAPRYVLPMASSAGFCLFSVLCIWTLSWSLRRENKRIRREDENATLFYAY